MPSRLYGCGMNIALFILNFRNVTPSFQTAGGQSPSDQWFADNCVVRTSSCTQLMTHCLTSYPTFSVYFLFLMPLCRVSKML